jgi:hypothetical protein
MTAVHLGPKGNSSEPGDLRDPIRRRKDLTGNRAPLHEPALEVETLL